MPIVAKTFQNLIPMKGVFGSSESGSVNIMNKNSEGASSLTLKADEHFNVQEEVVYLKEVDSMIPSYEVLSLTAANGLGSETSIIDADFDVGAKESKKAIGLASLPNQSKEFYKRKGSQFTLMVAGASGSGKTTLINSLFSSNLIHRNGPEQTTGINLHKFELVEDGFKLNLTAIDTPGFGDSIDNVHTWVPLTKFIEDQFRLYVFRSEQPDRRELVDTRVHCCLYLIPPSGTVLRPLDIRAMKELSSRVNIIPIVSKGDTLGEDNLKQFREIVRKTLKFHDIKVCDLILDTEVNDKINSMIPFVVVGSNKCNENNNGQLVRGRKYSWGVVEMENPLHSDFVKLRDVLVGSNMLDLVTLTEAHYDNFRTECLKFRARKQLLDEFKDGSSLKNGIDEYEIYHKYTFDKLLKNLEERNPILEYEARKMSARYAHFFSREEKRFKECKKALVDRQLSMNALIEKKQDLIAHLKEQVEMISSYSNSHIEGSERVNMSTPRGNRILNGMFKTKKKYIISSPILIRNEDEIEMAYI